MSATLTPPPPLAAPAPPRLAAVSARPAPGAPDARVAAAVRRAAWALGLGVAALQAWTARQQMNPDGVAYLDLSDTVAAGDARLPVNAYWSPAYPWLLGSARRLLAPTPAWEFPTAHLVNLVLFVAAFGAFEAFRRQLARVAPLAPGAAWDALAYALFLWATLRHVPVAIVTPDLLVAALALAAAALILRAGDAPSDGTPDAPRPPAGLRHPLVVAAAAGAVLGLGYLAKAAMFPIAAAFLAALAGTARRPGAAARRLAAGGAAFLAVALPYAAALSAAVGRPTFGETGRLNYAWYVNGARAPAPGVLRHPVRRVAAPVVAHEFAGPVAGTYPKWFDPAYWYDGVPTRLRLRDQLPVVRHHLLFYARLLWPWLLVLGAAWATAARAPRGRPARERRAVAWRVAGPAGAAFAMYALVHAEGRFFGAFVPLLVLGALAGLAPPAAAVARGRAAVVVAAAVAGALAAGDTHTARDVAAVLALAAAGACAWCLVRARGGGARAAAPATAAAAASAAAVGAAADVPPRAALLIAAGLAALALYGHGRPAALAGDRLRRGVLAVGAAFALLPVARLAAHLAGTARGGAARGAVWTPSPGGSPWEVATALRAAGVRPGDRVATVGTGDTAYWARLLRAQVVAEVPDSAVAALWAAPAGARDQLWRAFADVGVTAVVAAAVPAGTGPAAGAVATGWRPLGGGGAVLRLPRRPVPRPPGRSPRLPSPRP